MFYAAIVFILVILFLLKTNRGSSPARYMAAILIFYMMALFWLVLPGTEQAVQAFSTLSGRVAVMHRVPLDCALLAFAVCCITVAELQKRCSGQCEALHDQHKKTAAR